MNTTLPAQIHIRIIKNGWFKRTYELFADEKVLGELRYERFSYTKATAKIGGREFAIRRSGVWKHFVEISSTIQQYNHRFPINWRNVLKITDADGNPFTFKPSGVWQTKWQWLDRHQRPITEIKSKVFSKSNRGVVEIKHQDMNDQIFWIIVAWFVILCSETDSAVVVAS